MREQTTQLLQTHERPPINRYSPKGLQEYIHQIRTRMTMVFQETVKSHFPDHSVCTDPQELTQQSGYCWYLEPLSGEENFLRSLPDYCAVIGIFLNGSLQHTIVYQYLEDVEFYSTKDEGALVNQSRLRVSGTGALNQSVIAYAQQNSSPDFLHNIEELQRLGSSVRYSGCVALDLARVAQGKFDACIYTGENHLIPLSTSLLVTEAGGFTTPISRSEETFVAGNPQIFKALKSSLRGIKSDSILSRKK